MWKFSGGPLGVNVYVVPFGNGDCFVVDPGAGARQVAGYLLRESLFCRGIVLTHGHLDHTQALPGLLSELADSLPERAKPVVAIHGNDAKYIGSEGKETNRETFRAIGALDYFARFWVELPPSDILIKEGDGLFGSGFTVLHTPGHTPGSVCLYNPADAILLSGDTLFEGGTGRIDADGDGAMMASSLLKLGNLPGATKVFPGHGDPTTIGAEFRT